MTTVRIPSDRATFWVSLLNLAIWGSNAIYLGWHWSEYGGNATNALLPVALGMSIAAAGLLVPRERSRWWILIASVSLAAISVANFASLYAALNTHPCPLCEIVSGHVALISLATGGKAHFATFELLWNDIVLPLTILITLIAALTGLVRFDARRPAS